MTTDVAMDGSPDGGCGNIRRRRTAMATEGDGVIRYGEGGRAGGDRGE